MKTFLKAVSPVLFLLLSACGGSSDGPSTSGPAGSTRLTAGEFSKSVKTGVIRVDTNVDFSGAPKTVDAGGTTYTISASGKVNGSQVLSLIIDDTTVTSDSCALTNPEVETDTSASVLDDVDVDLSDCSDSYFKISDDEYRIELNCTGLTPSFAADFIYLSDDPRFDLGSLTLNFDPTLSDMSADDGVCGSILSNDITTKVTPAGLLDDSTESETAIEIVAPYVGGNRIKVELRFSDSSLEAGEYVIVNRLSEISTKEVMMELSSAAFGGTPEFPDTFSATGGVVTITSIGTVSYGGTYNVSLDNGDILTGSFAINLK